MKKGFTVVELLFVMAIIAVLAGFAITRIQSTQKETTKIAMINDALLLEKIVAENYARYGFYLDNGNTGETISFNGILGPGLGVGLSYEERRSKFKSWSSSSTNSNNYTIFLSPDRTRYFGRIMNLEYHDLEVDFGNYQFYSTFGRKKGPRGSGTTIVPTNGARVW